MLVDMALPHAAGGCFVMCCMRSSAPGGQQVQFLICWACFYGCGTQQTELFVDLPRTAEVSAVTQQDLSHSFVSARKTTKAV